jgi:hypothetical protein
MPVKKLRIYTIKDVELLVAGSTIVEAAIANKKFLQTKRPAWGDPFFDNLKSRIEVATQTYLGVDNAKTLRQATQTLTNIQQAALNALAECKVQIEEDFKKVKPQRDEILNLLGFKSYANKVRNGDQEALISLLFQFKKGMTTTLKTEITQAGTSSEIIEEIIGYADNLNNANISQEVLKGFLKDLTTAGVTEFNGIYEEVIAICKIAAKFFKDKPNKKEQFNFSKVVRSLNVQKAPKPGAKPKGPDKNS